MTLSSADVWTILTAATCAIACAVPGCFLVLRRLSMVGDAISHAILPGIVGAFILTSSRSILPMGAGAAVAGLCTVGLSQALTRWFRISSDAALGVVYSSLFALGVLLLSMFASSIDLDASCVLFGQLETVSLDTIGTSPIPRAMVPLLVAMLLNIGFVIVFRKELTIAAFDGALADSMGFRSSMLHGVMLALVALTCVASFEAVGSVLVVAMIVAPAAAARLLTDRLPMMVVLAAVIGGLSAVIGYVLAILINASGAGCVALAACTMCGLCIVLSPKEGLVIRGVRRGKLKLRIVMEDILGTLYRKSEGRQDRAWTLPVGVWSMVAQRQLTRRGLIQATSDGPALTARGEEAAKRVIRSHRLWETYLNEHLNLPLERLHDPSERMEHFIDPPLADRLQSELDKTHDAQGRPIP